MRFRAFVTFHFLALGLHYSKMKLAGILSAVLATALVAAAPADLAQALSPLDESGPLTKRATSCSNGIAVSCNNASASVSCSGSQCTYCCGSCCKKAKGATSRIQFWR